MSEVIDLVTPPKPSARRSALPSHAAAADITFFDLTAAESISPVSAQGITNDDRESASCHPSTAATSGQKILQWVCDVCKDKRFLDYREACEHEESCGKVGNARDGGGGLPPPLPPSRASSMSTTVASRVVAANASTTEDSHSSPKRKKSRPLEPRLVTPIHQWDLLDESISSEGSCKVPSESCVVIDKVENEEVDGESIDDKIPVTSITLPSSDIVELSQNFYWPLYARPVDWICQEYVTPDSNETEREACTLRVVEELQSLSFSRSQQDDTMHLSRENYDASKARNAARSNDASAQAIELHEEKEDWFSHLVVDKRAKSNLCGKCSCGINVQVSCWVRIVIWNSIRTELLTSHIPHPISSIVLFS